MVDRSSGGFGQTWWHLVVTRVAVGACFDVAGLVSTMTSSNQDDFYPFGVVTGLALVSGIIGFVYAYRLENVDSELRRWKGVVVWITSAPEAVVVIPLVLSIPVAAVVEPGPVLGNLLYLVVAGAAASLTVSIQGVMTWRWWKATNLFGSP